MFDIHCSLLLCCFLDHKMNIGMSVWIDDKVPPTRCNYQEPWRRLAFSLLAIAELIGVILFCKYSFCWWLWMQNLHRWLRRRQMLKIHQSVRWQRNCVWADLCMKLLCILQLKHPDNYLSYEVVLKFKQWLPAWQEIMPFMRCCWLHFNRRLEIFVTRGKQPKTGIVVTKEGQTMIALLICLTQSC